MPLVFSHFIMAAIPHVKCDVGSRRENWANGGSVDVFSHDKYGFTYREFMLF